MIINPNRFESQRLLACVPGTRILQETLGVIGAEIKDAVNPVRLWRVESLYAPIRGRAVGGVRARLSDNIGFVTFCNQRDLEVLLGAAEPGEWCAWLGADYVGRDDEEWLGFGVDDDDLQDDLYDRELLLRLQYQHGAILPEGSEISRRIHNGPREDYEELLLLTADLDHDTGWGPDTRFQTLNNRWRSVERTAMRERERLWYNLYANQMTLV